LVLQGLDASGKDSAIKHVMSGVNPQGVEVRTFKVMLNVSRQEQAKRFLKRIDHPDKNWKFSPSDVRERRHWEEYRQAFDIMLSQTSTKWAPWYVVPADHKWFSRLATAAILVRALHAIDPRYSAADPAAREQMMQSRAELVEEPGTGRAGAEQAGQARPR
jgi:polyphosphate kinase 2 (PPK2 family)